jgi:hypothetical protein
VERADTAPAPPVVIGLADDDAQRPTDAYFAAFRWEPPPIDPVSLSASVFLTMLDDVATTKA